MLSQKGGMHLAERLPGKGQREEGRLEEGQREEDQLKEGQSGKGEGQAGCKTGCNDARSGRTGAGGGHKSHDGTRAGEGTKRTHTNKHLSRIERSSVAKAGEERAGTMKQRQGDARCAGEAVHRHRSKVA